MYNAHSKYISKQMIVTLIMFIVNIILFNNSSVLFDFLCIIPVASLVFQLILTIKERKKFDIKKPKIRHIFIILYIIFTVLSLIVVGEEGTLVNIAAACGTVFSWFNLFALIISFLIVNVYERKRLSNKHIIDELDPIDGNAKIKKKQKTYPLGYISKKDYLLTTFSLILSNVILCVIFLVLSPDEFGGFEILFLFVSLFVAMFVIMIARTKKINKPLREFENTFEYEPLEKELLKVTKNDKVHIETINYYKILLANYVGVFSLEKRNEILSDVFIPSHPQYRLMYFMIKALEFADDKDKTIESYEKLKLDPELKSKSIIKQLDSYIYRTKVIYGEINVDDFDKKFPLRFNTNLAKIGHLKDKLKFYYYRNDINNANRIIEELKELIETIPAYPKDKIDIDKYKF